MRLVRLLASLMTFWVEKIKGPRTTEEVVVSRTRSESLTGHSVSGYEINICCLERRYRVRYRRWKWYTEEIRMFQVFATLSDNSPERLKEACKLDLCFPLLLGVGASLSKQREAAIAAYLDVLIGRLETSVVFAA